MAFSKDESVLIIGAGVFGLSTALHLLRTGWKIVTIIDRSPILPAPDAASTDINKIVRSSYDDPVYTRLAIDAIAAWKNKDEWGDTYHESGVIVRGGVDFALKNDLEAGANVKVIHSGEDLRPHLPNDVALGPLLTPPEFEGYINFDGGWANAEQGVKLALEKVRQLGAIVLPGKTAVGLSHDGHGVTLEDGTVIRADIVIIACGSWTAPSFPHLDMERWFIATGHSVAMLELSEHEANRYANTPVFLDHLTGFYVFPPNANNVMKFGIHDAGYTNPQGQSGISTPQTHVTHPDCGTIPHEMGGALLPALGYVGTVTPPASSVSHYMGGEVLISRTDSDWLIDVHPQYPSVLFATGGSGHGYKFLPVIGGLIIDRLEDKLDPALRQKFSFQLASNGNLEQRKMLSASQLWNKG